jgi:hypothetical protein
MKWLPLICVVLAPATATATEPQRGQSRTIIFTGACDASGAVPVSEQQFVVADDEDNLLRVYDAGRGGAPLHSTDLSAQVPLRKEDRGPAKSRNKKPKKAPEFDLEAATRLGDTAYWLTSHGRNSKGKQRLERFIFFATTLPRAGEPATLLGRPYVSLLDDLLAFEALRDFDLQTASERAPKEPGALNVEGLTAMANGGGVYIGFRNPLPRGRALIVPLLNPRKVIAGGAAQLGPPVLLDLGGLGIRALSWWRGRYLIVGGPFGDGGGSRLYSWTGRGPATTLPIDLEGLNPEGFFTPEERDEIMLLSDDGNQPIDGTPCKELVDPSQKRFRGRWVRLPSPGGGR